MKAGAGSGGIHWQRYHRDMGGGEMRRGEENMASVDLMRLVSCAS